MRPYVWARFPDPDSAVHIPDLDPEAHLADEDDELAAELARWADDDGSVA